MTDNYLEEVIKPSATDIVIDSSDDDSSSDEDKNDDITLFGNTTTNKNKKIKKDNVKSTDGVSEERVLKKKDKFDKLKAKRKEIASIDEDAASKFMLLSRDDIHTFFWETYISSQGRKLSKMELKPPPCKRDKETHIYTYKC